MSQENLICYELNRTCLVLRRYVLSTSSIVPFEVFYNIGKRFAFPFHFDHIIAKQPFAYDYSSNQSFPVKDVVFLTAQISLNFLPLLAFVTCQINEI